MTSRTNASDLARGRWRDLLSACGVDSRYLVNKHGPCPICHTEKKHFRFDDKGGSGSYFCNHCRSGDGFDLLCGVTGWDFAKAAREIERLVGAKHIHVTKSEAKRIDPRIRIDAVSRAARPLNGRDPASMYLHNRGLKVIPEEILYTPRIKYFEDGKPRGVFPAMLAIVRQRGRAVTYHITYLTDDGRKAQVDAPKKVLPPIRTMTGGCIHLFGHGEHVCITGGIETGIAAQEYSGLPVLVAVNANGMERLELPTSVTSATIFGDNDLSFTGHKAAYTLAPRLTLAGVEVDVVMARDAGTDWLDEWVRLRRGDGRQLYAVS